MSLVLRLVEPSDCKLLFDWANDEVTRANAFNTGAISWEEHQAWFSRMMEAPSEMQFILMNDSESIGQIRLTIDGDTAEIDYSIDHRQRGCGYGQQIIGLVRQHVSDDYPEIKKLVAKVKPSNEPSYFCFKRNGFEEKYRFLEYRIDNE